VPEGYPALPFLSLLIRCVSVRGDKSDDNPLDFGDDFGEDDGDDFGDFGEGSNFTEKKRKTEMRRQERIHKTSKSILTFLHIHLPLFAKRP